MDHGVIVSSDGVRRTQVHTPRIPGLCPWPRLPLIWQIPLEHQMCAGGSGAPTCPCVPCLMLALLSLLPSLPLSPDHYQYSSQTLLTSLLWGAFSDSLPPKTQSPFSVLSRSSRAMCGYLVIALSTLSDMEISCFLVVCLPVISESSKVWAWFIYFCIPSIPHSSRHTAALFIFTINNSALFIETYYVPSIVLSMCHRLSH